MIVLDFSLVWWLSSEPTLKKMLVKMGIFPKDRGEHKKYLKPPPRQCFFLLDHHFWVLRITSPSSPKSFCVGHVYCLVVGIIIARFRRLSLLLKQKMMTAEMVWFVTHCAQKNLGMKYHPPKNPVHTVDGRNPAPPGM